jgi:hypothetical protein
MSTASNTPGAVQEQPSPKALLKQLVAAASSGTAFDSFLHSHLAEDVRGAVAPRYLLNKPETIRRLTEVFAMAAGGNVTMVSGVEEGSSACARVLLTKKKHDLRITPKIDPRKEVVVEAALWLELGEHGQIVQLNFVADMLTPGGAMGMKMVRAPSPAMEAATA